jgi:hypothetical protein
VAALGVVLASLATAQVAILQIQVLEGDGGGYPPGAKAPRPVVVEVTDEMGRPVAGVAVSFHLPEDGPSGTFANGLRTDVAMTDDHGRAAPRPLVFNRVPGQFSIRIIATKEQATAGTLALTSIGDAASAKEARSPVQSGAKAEAPAAARSQPRDVSPGHGHKKLILILAAVAGGAAAGMLIRSEESKSSSSTAAPETTATPPTIGAPTVSVGRP